MKRQQVVPRHVGPGSCIVPDWADPLTIDDRCWWRYTGTAFVLEILPAYRNVNMADAAEARADEALGRARKITEEMGNSFGLPDGTRLVLDETPLLRCSCYRDDVRDPNCRVHGTAAKSSTVGRPSARERSTVGLHWEKDR